MIPILQMRKTETRGDKHFLQVHRASQILGEQRAGNDSFQLTGKDGVMVWNEFYRDTEFKRRGAVKPVLK